jgi:hypothetical protein
MTLDGRAVRLAVGDVLRRTSRRLDIATHETLHQASYLELARRTPWLDEVPLASSRGGTANFSLLFVLLSILRHGHVARVLELGVGHSTRLLAQFVRDGAATLTSVEHDAGWLERVALGHPYVTAIHAPLAPVEVAGRRIHWYDCPRPQGSFDLLLVDGPPAHARPIRYDRLGILTWLPDVLAEEFVIVVDDTSRRGERMLVQRMLARLEASGRRAARRDVVGWTCQSIVATTRFASILHL